MNWKLLGIIGAIIWAIASTVVLLYKFVGVSGASITISLLIILVFTLAYIIFNLYKKLKTLETWTSSFIARVSYVDEQLELIDSEGAFEADDEVGFVFKEIRRIIKVLTDLTEQDGVDATQEEEK